jgi:RND family efflux transporter MFP subunit
VPSLHKTFPGRVARTSQTLQMSTRTMDTQVDVPNPNFTLVPGMYAEVNLRLDESDDALVVPVDSVDAPGAAARVFVVQNGRLHSAPVATGLENAQRIEIRSGLQEGDMVVVGRQAGLKDGETVQAKVADFAGH